MTFSPHLWKLNAESDLKFTFPLFCRSCNSMGNIKGAPYMSLFHLFILAVIQGLTEFLPVSSSGHLILLPSLTGAADQGLAIDVAVHVGTLFAVVMYFLDRCAHCTNWVHTIGARSRRHRRRTSCPIPCNCNNPSCDCGPYLQDHRSKTIYFAARR